MKFKGTLFLSQVLVPFLSACCSIASKPKSLFSIKYLRILVAQTCDPNYLGG